MFKTVMSRLGGRVGLGWSAVRALETGYPRVPTSALSVFGGSLGRSQQLIFGPPGQVMHMHDLHTKGDQELVGFLTEEIATEKKSARAVGKSVDDFQVETKEAEVTMSKKFNDEKITVSFNVNHTVDAENVDENIQPGTQPEEAGEMKSRPNFDVDISKGNQTLSFTCSFLRDVSPAEGQEEYNDIFVIDEITLYEGECKDETYAVAGEILDGYLYDLFMNMLEERGVTNEFVEKMSEYATTFEHSLYINMLSKLQKFVQS